MTLIHNLGMFLLGIRDSMSLGWIRKVLFCVDPSTFKLHKYSYLLMSSLKSSFIQVVLYIFIIPFILNLLGIYYIAFALRGLFLLLTYGYLFFYNEDILEATRKIILWRQRQYPGTHFELDALQRIQSFTLFASQIKSIIFIIFYYLPIMIFTIVISLVWDYGYIISMISQAFFNATFFFLSTWHYDKYNVAFLEKQKYYMLGYGFVLSFICQVMLSGFASLGFCLVFSLWMLINSVIYSPVETQFKSLGQIWQVLTKHQKRNALKNAYNVHRKKVRGRTQADQQYRRKLIMQTFFLVNPVLKITQYINSIIYRFMQERFSLVSNENDNNQNSIPQDPNIQLQNNQDGNHQN